MSDEFFASIMKVQRIYYYSSPQKMWIHEKSILGVLGQKYLKFAIVYYYWFLVFYYVFLQEKFKKLL